MSKKNLGIISALIAAIVYGLMPLVAKIVYLSGIPPISLVFYRSFLSIVPLYFLMRKYKNTVINKKIIFQIFFLTLFGVVFTQILLYSSYNYVSSGLATTLHFSYPVFTVVGCIFYMKIPANKLKIFCVILTSIGMLLVYSPESNNTILGMLFAFLSGFTYSIYIIALKQTNLSNMNPFQLGFYISSFSSIITFVFALFTHQMSYTTELSTILLLFAFSLILTLFCNVLFQLAVRYIGPQSSSILSTFEPIVSIIIGIVIFSEILTPTIFLGIVCILASVIIIAKFDKS